MEIMDSTEKTWVFECARSAVTLVESMYYRCMDHSRQDMFKMYRQNSTLLWDGQEFLGVEDISALMSELPLTKHTIKTFDAQPMLEKETKLIFVTGSVEYSEQKPRNFSHQFVLSKDDEGADFLLFECFRLLS